MSISIENFDIKKLKLRSQYFWDCCEKNKNFRPIRITKREKSCWSITLLIHSFLLLLLVFRILYWSIWKIGFVQIFPRLLLVLHSTLFNGYLSFTVSKGLLYFPKIWLFAVNISRSHHIFYKMNFEKMKFPQFFNQSSKKMRKKRNDSKLDLF